MCDNYKYALETIKEQLISDYYTPTYRFEVAFDTLITPYIAELVNNSASVPEVSNTKFVAKEMSIKDREKTNNRSKKIDYVLTDDKFTYMVELKTADSSVNDGQADYYLKIINQGKSFREVLGQRLIDNVYNMYKNTLDLKKDANKVASNEDFKIFLETTLNNAKEELPANTHIENNNKYYANIAKKYLKTNKNLISTCKYLLTAGQVYDYFKKYEDESLWQKPLKLIYITPNGTPPKIVDEKKEFYAGTISLKDHVQKYLKEQEDDELAQMLASAIKEIYGEPQ